LSKDHSILVTGLLERDSGKTHITSNLIHLFTQKGFTIIPFKPLSGHNFVYHYTNTLKNVKRGHLLSMDIQQLAYAANLVESNKKVDISLEVMNPTHILFTNLLIEPYIQEKITSSYFSMFNHSIPILQRYTIINLNDSLLSRHIYAIRENNQNFYSRIAIDTKTFKLLKRKGNKKIYFSNKEEFKQISEKHYRTAIESCFKKIQTQRPDLIIIESINNAAVPFSSKKISKTIKIVLAVQPGMVLSFDPQRYFLVLEEFSHFNGLIGKTLESILKILKPEKIFRIPITQAFQKEDKLVRELLCYLNDFV